MSSQVIMDKYKNKKKTLSILILKTPITTVADDNF